MTSSQSTSHDLTSTVAKHYNQLQEAGLEERNKSRIFYMRNFNNWTKSVLINEFMTKVKRQRDRSTPLTVLDMCSGKGGDLLKWKKADIDRLVCADIAETSVKQSEERYNDMRSRSGNDRFHSKIFSAEFISADLTKIRLKDLYKDPEMCFDMVSCQFSFHYCFESLPQAEMMIRNACECIKPGGFFIGTTPNSHELVKRARAADDKRSFGNEVYSVTFQDENTDNLPLFGAKYDFHLEGVVDCPEFLVYFPAFEKLAEKYGMKLVYKSPFADYFQRQIEHGDSRVLLEKMQALEPYPGTDRNKLVSDKSSDYTAAKVYHEKLTAAKEASDHRKNVIGTLSQAEWEAITIYTVFAFQKVDHDSHEVVESETGRKRTHTERDATEPQQHNDESPASTSGS